MAHYVISGLITFISAFWAHRAGYKAGTKQGFTRLVLRVRKNVLEQTEGKTLEQINKMRVEALEVWHSLHSKGAAL
jgi:hypothetical protein